MDFKIHSNDKKALTQGKQYLGTGLYKDENFTWELSKTGADWIIKRVAATSNFKLNDATAKNYWSKIFTKEMLDATFDKKTVAKSIDTFLEPDSFIIESKFVVSDPTKIQPVGVTVSITKNANANDYVMKVGSQSLKYNGKQISLSKEIGGILDTFDRTAATEVLAEMLSSPSFTDFLIYNLEEN